MSAVLYDKELERYRNLMLPPGKFADGFRWSSLVGAVFIALLMVPGAMYMGLVAGQGVGPAAQWVTVILFIEIARRAHRTLSRPELYVLFYMASAVMASPFSGLLWNQFYVQSQAAYSAGIAGQLPKWYAPGDPAVLDQRSFMMWDWLPAIGIVFFGTFVGRINNAILGYGLFRVTSDIEKLPFPMAPVGAQGIMALAEQSEEEKARGEDSWRWRVFSVGGVLGLAFGALYVGLPTISGALFDTPIVILPIPFSDWTSKTQDWLPAFATGLDWNLGNLLWGMVMPFFAMVGSFVALVITLFLNPVLYKFNILRTWQPNDATLPTMYKNNIDFYFSFSIGLMLAIALVGFWQVYRSLRNRRKTTAELESPDTGPIAEGTGRGDIKTVLVLGTYFVSTMAYILLSGWLIDWDWRVMLILCGMGFVYTPLISYVSARLQGMAGQVVDIPFVREAAFILSGYEGAKIWFLPIPLQNYGDAAVNYRVAELIGTKFWSIWKAELALVPIVLIASIFFANFIWGLAPIPSAQYPFAEKMWEYNAAMQSVVVTSTLGRFSEFERAIDATYLGAGAALGMVLFVAMTLLHLPIMLFYGLVRGLNQTLPHVVAPQFIGALLGRYYFEKKLGLKWGQYVPVVAAGFSCGMGLITVLCVGVTFLAKAVISLPY
jgi:hypothetical protein